jgi:predicted MFS family arabinose efflux permease
MTRILIFIGMTVGGWIGWLVAERFGIMTAFFVSSLGSVAGVFAGWWLGRRWFS